MTTKEKNRGFTLPILEWITLVSCAVVALSLLYLVAARYWLNLPDGGMHTLALIAAMWLYMTGALLASRSREHLSIEILAHQLSSPRALAIHRLVVSILVLIIVAIFLYWTYRMFAWGSRFSATMPSFNIPIWVPQLAIGLNAVGSLCYAIRDVRESFLALIHGDR
ncbi:MAG: TRAP transporter small permease subunit [Burkholderiaceae bacterium]|nr:TRAP transporter small permease subunit [Burkholderiaceae bacterium]